MNNKKLASLILLAPMAFSVLVCPAYANPTEEEKVQALFSENMSHIIGPDGKPTKEYLAQHMPINKKPRLDAPREKRIISLKPGEAVPEDAINRDSGSRDFMAAEVEIPEYTLDENGKAEVKCANGETIFVSREFLNGNIVTIYRRNQGKEHIFMLPQEKANHRFRIVQNTKLF